MYTSSIFGNTTLMIKSFKNIHSIKEEIQSFYDRPVAVSVNLGRNKIQKFTGILTGIYPALVTVSPDDSSYRGKTSYSYAEILCGIVKITARP